MMPPSQSNNLHNDNMHTNTHSLDKPTLSFTKNLTSTHPTAVAMETQELSTAKKGSTVDPATIHTTVD